jgi:hypothetical protein
MYNQTNDGSVRGYVPRHAQPPQQQPQQTAYQPQPQPYQPQQYQYQPQQPVYQAPQYQQPKEDRISFFAQRDKVLMVSAIIAIVWFIIVCSSFASLLNATPSGDEMDQLAHEIGTSIGFALQIPFLITSFLGIVFNVIGWLISKKGFALTAGILFSVSFFLSIGNAIGYVPCLVLCFIGYSRLKKQAV